MLTENWHNKDSWSTVNTFYMKKPIKSPSKWFIYKIQFLLLRNDLLNEVAFAQCLDQCLTVSCECVCKHTYMCYCRYIIKLYLKCKIHMHTSMNTAAFPTMNIAPLLSQPALPQSAQSFIFSLSNKKDNLETIKVWCVWATKPFSQII